jgi:hypothetical protein
MLFWLPASGFKNGQQTAQNGVEGLVKNVTKGKKVAASEGRGSQGTNQGVSYYRIRDGGSRTFAMHLFWPLIF